MSKSMGIVFQPIQSIRIQAFVFMSNILMACLLLFNDSKKITSVQIIEDRVIPENSRVLWDQIIESEVPASRKKYPGQLRQLEGQTNKMI